MLESKRNKILISAVLCLTLGSLSGFFTVDSVSTWYQTINKPSWNPPGWLFGPVWTTLYIMMGASFALVWHSNHPSRKRAMALFVFQLILNLIWTPIFFGLNQIGWSFVVIIVLLLTLAATIMKFNLVNKTAAWLLVPYILWVGFATVLTGTIWYLNSNGNQTEQSETIIMPASMDQNNIESGSTVLTWKGVLALAKNGNKQPDRRVEKTDAEWKKILTDEQYYVMRKKGTERPFSTEMCSRFEPGIYACAGCGTPLFDSATKYQSGTGWPSFSLPMKDNVVSYIMDNTFGMTRVETICSTCDSHLGHVFPDGPEPSGLRYCINASSLKKTEL
jgi:peptide-methionine (R)-S-oxide reductase